MRRLAGGAQFLSGDLSACAIADSGQRSRFIGNIPITGISVMRNRMAAQGAAVDKQFHFIAICNCANYQLRACGPIPMDEYRIRLPVAA